MKKFLLSSVALLGLTAGAVAADLPARRAAPAPFVAVPVFTWTGFYVGVNAGYGFNSNNNDNYGYPFFGAPTAFNPFFYGNGNNGSDGGFVGGGQVGYNYQFGSLVVGVEADLQYADLGGRNNGYYGFYGDNGGSDGYFGTVRARIGVAFDRVLVYATGGFAYGDVNSGNNGYGYPGFGTVGFPFGYGYGRRDETNTGYAVGGGIEYAVTNNITVRLEGLYVNLDNGNNNNDYPYFLGTTAFNPFFYGDNRKNDNEFGVVRAAVNFKF
jgi:outer membrane immunogenic protein